MSIKVWRPQLQIQTGNVPKEHYLFGHTEYIYGVPFSALVFVLDLMPVCLCLKTHNDFSTRRTTTLFCPGPHTKSVMVSGPGTTPAFWCWWYNEWERAAPDHDTDPCSTVSVVWDTWKSGGIWCQERRQNVIWQLLGSRDCSQNGVDGGWMKCWGRSDIGFWESVACFPPCTRAGCSF